MITKRITPRLFSILFCLLSLGAFSQLPVLATEEAGYLNDSIKIMLRSGKGADYRIIAMPTLGQKITVLEKAEGWVKIRTENGTEGWVLSRFVGYEVPYRIRFETLNQEHQKNSRERSVIDQENARLAKENREMAQRLKTEVGEMASKVEKLTRENRILRDEVSNRLIKWFLAGAGVLFFGLLIGYALKRERRKSYLL